ncbi:glutamine amidotransferase [Catalinimonas alkaloidigena]|uniref:Imidazole glycerol phosphate synthase subunit HisH n=1 Tax=Catalinimonas alkaloidigena TaxID=1075417 RepID=A0A1G9IW86_9BACT|nr:imidazole glycerol phosphate synthase subunit HisH [Catalinimonas alkaloidigena]SDL29518.1 glutamine amidotransferase [Catalinimonas alkaloidigena]
MKTVIIKYNAGNVQSVKYALERLGIEPILSDEEEVIRSADRVIFPGVGEASTAMGYLREKGLDQLLPTLTQPVLGVCLGLQLMCTHSEENDTPCLGIFDVEVKRFRPDEAGQKVPHMGWNTISPAADADFPLLREIEIPAYVYFVHSYYAEMSSYTMAACNYIVPFSAMLHKDNFYAAQFHPEKSGLVGAQILKNFVELKQEELV